MAEAPTHNQLSQKSTVALCKYLETRKADIVEDAPTADTIAAQAEKALGFRLTASNIRSMLNTLGIVPGARPSAPADAALLRETVLTIAEDLAALYLVVHKAPIRSRLAGLVDALRSSANGQAMLPLGQEGARP